VADISKERALKIARAHACSSCKEYSYRKLTVTAATAAVKAELGAIWIATKTCGICKYQEEIGIAADGDVVYEG
jgi:hypothetical protein